MYLIVVAALLLTWLLIGEKQGNSAPVLGFNTISSFNNFPPAVRYEQGKPIFFQGHALLPPH